jgi:hypothetical protein
MAEYSQYQATNPIDWGNITQNILEKLDKVEEIREAKRVELDKQYTDVISTVDKYQGSKAPTFNQFIMDGANNVRNSLYEQNQLLKKGKITPSEYSRIVSTSKDSWSRLADMTKQYDANYEEGLKRAQEGKAAGQEIYQRQMTADLLNLKDKTTFMNPKDGRMYIAEVDPVTKKIKDESKLVDLQTINAGLNQNVDKLNVSNEVNAYVKNLGSEARMVNGRYVISQAIRGKFNSKTKPEIIDAITNNPRKAASVLYDNTTDGYSFTYNAKEINSINSQIDKLAAQKESVKSDADKKAIQKEINSLSSQRDKTILLVRDENGIFTPQLSEGQMKKAKSIVDDVIESQIDYKVEKPERITQSDINRGEKQAAKEADLADRFKKVLDIGKNFDSSEYIGEIRGRQYPDNLSNSRFEAFETDLSQIPEPIRKKNPNAKLYAVVSEKVKTPQNTYIEKPNYKPILSEIQKQDIINRMFNEPKGLQVDWTTVQDFNRPKGGAAKTSLVATPKGGMSLNATAIKNKTTK